MSDDTNTTAERNWVQPGRAEQSNRENGRQEAAQWRAVHALGRAPVSGRVSFEIAHRQQGLWFWYDLMATIDGVTERVGRDGGESEDMNLHRDLKWVKPALERFYALGIEHGRAALRSPVEDRPDIRLGAS